MRFWLFLLIVPLLAGQAVAQSAPARECLRINASPPDMFDRDTRERANKKWIELCQQAFAADGNDLVIKRALARAYGVDGQRAEEIKLLRELGAQNQAEALFELYDTFKSYDRGDVNKPQLVKREEAEAALRKSAELGHAYATMMLAVLLDRGATVKRDLAGAIIWAERAITNPAKDQRPIDMQVLLGRLLVKSDKPDERARGIALLEDLSKRGRGDAKAYLATAIRASDPVRARKLLEEGMRGYGGAALPELADMLIKGEGGPADEKRAVSLLQKAPYTPGVRGALGQLYIEGRGVPRDLPKGVEMLDNLARWDYDARLQVMGLLASNPELRITHPAGFLYQASEAADLGEPGAMAALIALKLSQSAQFRDKPGGCALAEKAAKQGDAVAAPIRQ